MSVEIRDIVVEDLSEVLRLMREFAKYERLERFLEVDEERLATALFDPGAFVEGFIATVDDIAVGYAIFYPNFLTFRGQQGYFLEDLYVSESVRGTGLGKALLREVAERARSRGFERIDFLVLDWNTSAIEFYSRLGAARSEGESHFKFTDSSFSALCER